MSDVTEPLPVGEAVASAHGAITRMVALASGGLVDEATTPCSRWTVRDLVRHLEAIAGAYVLWASAAIGGRVGDLRMGAELAAYNQQMLQRLPDHGIARHMTTFSQLASDHLRIVEAFPDLRMLRVPATEVVWTVGDHAGVAALEWHLHAWDLSRAAGTVHVPDAAPLAIAWAATLGPALDVPLEVDGAGNGAVWDAVLRASGRTP